MSKSRLAAISKKVDNWFGVTRAGSSLGTELRAGLTTFLTMAYILFVNPEILSQAIHIDGVDVRGQLLTATAIAASVGSLLMGLWARYPFALAPGMGLNAYFTFSVVLGLGIDWRAALGAVLTSGVVFLLLSLAGIRDRVIQAIPTSLKAATTAGIGLFLAIIGLGTIGIVEPHRVTLVTLGNLTSATVLIGVLGLLTMTSLLILRVRGAILIGIVATTAAAIVSGAPVFDHQPFAGLGGSFLRAPVLPTDLLLQLDLAGAFQRGILGVVFIFLFVDLFDTAGTLMGLSDRCGYLTKQGALPRARQAFSADAIATGVGALVGTSTTTTYIESATGIQDGGRTGLTAVVVGVLFLLSVFLSPLAGAVPAVATAPALIVVGTLMMASQTRINWSDYREAVPAFLTMVGMPLTYSIANGIAFGIITHVALQVTTGRWRKVHWLMALLAALLVARYAYLQTG